MSFSPTYYVYVDSTHFYDHVCGNDIISQKTSIGLFYPLTAGAADIRIFFY